MFSWRAKRRSFKIPSLQINLEPPWWNKSIEGPAIKPVRYKGIWKQSDGDKLKPSQVLQYKLKPSSYTTTMVLFITRGWGCWNTNFTDISDIRSDGFGSFFAISDLFIFESPGCSIQMMGFFFSTDTLTLTWMNTILIIRCIHCWISYVLEDYVIFLISKIQECIHLGIWNSCNFLTFRHV